jgi:hypothetical protein
VLGLCELAGSPDLVLFIEGRGFMNGATKKPDPFVVGAVSLPPCLRVAA